MNTLDAAVVTLGLEDFIFLKTGNSQAAWLTSLYLHLTEPFL
jgi:hypothetical protein